MACAVAPTSEVPRGLQRPPPAAPDTKGPCPNPAPLKVKLKIKIGGRVADKQGPTAAAVPSSQDNALQALKELASQCRKAAREDLPPQLPTEWAPFPRGKAGAPSADPTPAPQPEPVASQPSERQDASGQPAAPSQPAQDPAVLQPSQAQPSQQQQDAARQPAAPLQPAEGPAGLQRSKAQPHPSRPAAPQQGTREPGALPPAQPDVPGGKRSRQSSGQLACTASAGAAVDCHIPKRARSSVSAGDQQGFARKRRSPSQPVDEGFREKRQAVSSDEAPGQAQQHDKAPSKPSYSRLRPDGHDKAREAKPSQPEEAPIAPKDIPPARQPTPQLQTQSHTSQQRPDPKPRPAELNPQVADPQPKGADAKPRSTEPKPRPAEPTARPAEVGKSSDDSSQDVHHPAAAAAGSAPVQRERSIPHGRPQAPTPLPAMGPSASRGAPRPGKAGGRAAAPGGSLAGMLKLLSMAAALPTQDHWILQMDAAALHRKAVDSKRNAEFLKQDTNTGNLKVFLAYVAAGVYFMAWCCKLEEDTLSAAMPRSGELQKLVQSHDQTITFLSNQLRECPATSENGSHQLGRILLERVIAALQLRTVWLYRAHLKLDCTLLSRPAPALPSARTAAAAEAGNKLRAKAHAGKSATPVAQSPSSNTSTNSAASGLAASQGGAQAGSGGAAGASASALPPSSPANARAEAERRLALRASSALQAHERVANTAKELQALAARSDDTPSLETTLGALAAMCLDGAGSDLRCSVVCAKLALDTDVFKPR